jgi:hypothetical protein
MSERSLIVRLAIFCASLLAPLLITAAKAEITLVKSGGLDIRLQAGGGVLYEYSKNPGFGSGVEDQADGDRRIEKQNNNIEAFGYVGFSAIKRTKSGNFLAVANGIASYTGLEGDTLGLSRGPAHRIDYEEAYLGWTSGNMFAGLPANAVSITIGPQAFRLNDGFVLWDGNDDGRRDGASSLALRQAFSNGAVVQFDGSYFHLDAFWLQADPDQFNSKLFGGQAGVIWPKVAEFGATAFKIYESDTNANPRVSSARDGMTVVNFYGVARLETSRLKGKIQGGYTGQSGSVKVVNQPLPRLDYDAEAFYVLGEIIAPQMSGKPQLRYRYSSFSGGDPTTDFTIKDYDPLFIDPVEYGALGFFTGTNTARHEIRLTVEPLEGLKLTSTYIASRLQKPIFRARRLSSLQFSNLYNFTAEYAFNRKLKLIGFLSVEDPKSAAREYFGSNKKIISSGFLATYDW